MENNTSFTNKNFLTTSLIIKKLIALLTKKGKKVKAEKILKKIFFKISLTDNSILNVLSLAINNVKPLVEVRTVRARGKTFQVPFPIKTAHQINIALKIILNSAKNKASFDDSLAEELINSSLNKSSSINATINLHKLAVKNRLFMHYRWS
jgi:small subunit ribosomal protein S7